MDYFLKYKIDQNDYVFNINFNFWKSILVLYRCQNNSLNNLPFENLMN